MALNTSEVLYPIYRYLDGADLGILFYATPFTIYITLLISGTHSSNERGCCLHGGQSSIPYLDGDQLGSWGHSIQLRLIWKVGSCYRGHMGAMGTWGRDLISKLMCTDLRLIYGVFVTMGSHRDNKGLPPVVTIERMFPSS